MGNENRRSKDSDAPTYHTRAVARACRILTTFSADDLELSIADLHKRLEIHKSTLVRLLRCMADEGFIEQNPETEKYRLGIKTFEVGSLYHRARLKHIETFARPYMQRFVNMYDLSANLAIRDGIEIVYISALEPHNIPLRVVYSVGDRFGLYHTSLGKALIAFLPDEDLGKLVERIEFTALTPRTLSTTKELLSALKKVRDWGFAVDDEESMPGLRCVGAPIWSKGGILAALSASGSTLIVTKERIEEIAGTVVEAANQISVQLGGVPVRRTPGQTDPCRDR